MAPEAVGAAAYQYGRRGLAGQYVNSWAALTCVADRAGVNREGDPIGGPVAMRLSVDGSWSTVGQTLTG